MVNLYVQQISKNKIKMRKNETKMTSGVLKQDPNT